MMFWRQRDRAVRSEQKAAAMTKDIARPANSGLSAYDFQMQSLKSSLAIYVSETNVYEDEMSTKSNMTHGTEMSMPASMYNESYLIWCSSHPHSRLSPIRISQDCSSGTASGSHMHSAQNWQVLRYP